LVLRTLQRLGFQLSSLLHRLSLSPRGQLQSWPEWHPGFAERFFASSL
jgi:hypothetical protein